jgi:hypothetical protein
MSQHWDKYVKHNLVTQEKIKSMTKDEIFQYWRYKGKIYTKQKKKQLCKSHPSDATENQKYDQRWNISISAIQRKKLGGSTHSNRHF